MRAINWDIFTPISSQEEMVDRAEDYEWQDQNQVTVMGGLVFDDVPEGGVGGAEEACPGISQPKVYIRMNSSLVHDTTTFRQRSAFTHSSSLFVSVCVSDDTIPLVSIHCFFLSSFTSLYSTLEIWTPIGFLNGVVFEKIGA